MSEGRAAAAPAVAVAGVAVLAFALYQLGPAPLADVVAVPYGVALVLGPGVLHVLARRRGAGPRAALLAAFAVPTIFENILFQNPKTPKPHVTEPISKL